METQEITNNIKPKSIIKGITGKTNKLAGKEIKENLPN